MARITRTLDQRVAEAERLLSLRRQKQRQLLTRQKIIVGGAVLADAMKDAGTAGHLADLLRQKVARGPDLTAIEPVLARLDEVATTARPPASEPTPEALGVVAVEVPDVPAPPPLSEPEPQAQAQAPEVAPPIDPLAGLESVGRRPSQRRI